MAIQGPFPFWSNPTTYPGLSQAGRSNYLNQGYSSFHNCYFPVDFIIMDMKSTKDFIDSPIILGIPFLATAKAITDWGKGEVIFQVGDSTMKVSINKLMRHPSHESDEVGAVDIYEDPEITSCIEETMVAIEDESFKEPEDDPFPSRKVAPEL